MSRLGFDEDSVGFDVKLPPTNDFDNFTEYINDFQKFVLSCPYLRNDNEKITLKKVDVGSIWICFSVIGVGVAGTVLLSNLGKIVDQAIKIKSHILSCKQQEAQLRAMNQKNEVLDKVLEGFDSYKKTLIQQCTDELKSSIGNVANGEEEEQVRKTLNTLGTLMSKGMEIYASIDTPDEVKDLFPTSDEIKSLNEPIKMLIEESKTE